jgi:hypothetical protein
MQKYDQSQLGYVIQHLSRKMCDFASVYIHLILCILPRYKNYVSLCSCFVFFLLYSLYNLFVICIHSANGPLVVVIQRNSKCTFHTKYMFFHNKTHCYSFFFFFFHWHYSPLWALACRTRSFHLFPICHQLSPSSLIPFSFSFLRLS